MDSNGNRRMYFCEIVLAAIDNMKAQGTHTVAWNRPKLFRKFPEFPLKFQTAEGQQVSFVLRAVINKEVAEGWIEIEVCICVVRSVAESEVRAGNERFVNATFGKLIGRGGIGPGSGGVPLGI